MSLERLYTQMLRIRLFEEALLQLFSLGRLRGTVHTCLGQEACAVGVAGALDPDRDTVSSNHRGHGHFLAFQGDMKGMLAEILGLSSGICNGKGGSQHLHFKNFYSNGVLGGMVPVTAGMALAQKRENKQGVSVVFVGDGAMAEGVIYETLNIASLWQLPILLVIEHNQIAQSTPWILEHGSPIEARPVAFGVKTETVDGNDVSAVRSQTEKIVSEMRLDPHPRCLMLNTYRLGPHSKGDDHRSRDELALHRVNDPLKRAASSLSELALTEISELCHIELRKVMNDLSLS